MNLIDLMKKSEDESIKLEVDCPEPDRNLYHFRGTLKYSTMD